MKRLITLILSLLILQLQVHAQQYPVQVTPQLLPPYSLQVSDYYSPVNGGSKLNLLLLLRDFNRPQLSVRLRMIIEGQGVSIKTREDVSFTQLTLESAVPKYVDASELAQYFNADNLQFNGITRQQYEQSGKLPEGFYTFCFEVIETGTGQTVSNKGCTFAWLTLNEPPILNMPRKAEDVAPVNPQNILFQWTPRHTASPTAAFVTEYIFTIAELNDNAIAPEAAFLTNAPIYTDSVNSTTYLYDLSRPALTPGKKYAWRIQAKAKNGLQDLAMFRNYGYSETFWFTYQNDCPMPLGIGASVQGQRVNIDWQNDPKHLEYKIEYREKNNPDAVWFETGNTLPRVSISDLKPNTLYEYRVGGACDYGRFTFGNLLSFTTNGSNASTVAECGIDPHLTEPNTALLQQLKPGDIIHAGDFDVVIVKVSGQGNFSGEGYVKVSWLADVKLAVRFTNITVTTDNRLKSGVIETTYNGMEEGVGDVEETIRDIRNLPGIINDLLNLSITNDYQYFKRLKDAFENVIDAEIADEMKNEFTDLVNSLDGYKKEYDGAKNEYDNSPTGQEKDEAKQLMEKAEQNFNLSREKLNSLEKERQKLATDVTDIFIKAVKELKDETNTNYLNIPSEFQSKKEIIIDEIYSGQGLIQENISAPDPAFIYKGSYYDSIPDNQVPQGLRSFADKLKDFAQKKKNYKLLVHIKALEKYYVQQNKRESLRDDSILEGLNMVKEIVSRYKKNESELMIKAFIKTYILEKITHL